MRNEEEKLDQLFAKFDSDWDVVELPKNHENRFMDKLSNKAIKNRKRNLYTTISIAATVLVMFSLSFFFKPDAKVNKLTFASKETKQTDSIFNVLIKNELNKLKELETNGESKQIINAMISNLQTRISFLQNVLFHIEKNEKLKNISDEKTI